jgi:hypothetical protein
MSNLSLEEFINTQYIDLSKILCDECKVNNKSKTYNNEFFTCLDCVKNLCPLCRRKHGVHRIINYNDKNYICFKHNSKFMKYCFNCKLNFCIFCSEEHKYHYLFDFSENLFKNKINEIKQTISNINKFIEEQIKIYNNVKEFINKLNDIYCIIYDTNNLNYQNVKNFNQKTVFPNEINHKGIIDIYNKINNIQNININKPLYYVGNSSKSENNINIRNYGFNYNPPQYYFDEVQKQPPQVKIHQINYKREEYGYQTLNDFRKPAIIYEGNNLIYKLDIYNNLNNPWPKYETKIVFDKDNSAMNGHDIILEPQEKNVSQVYDIFIESKNHKAGDYYITLCFEVSGKRYGDKMRIPIKILRNREEILEKNNENIRINEFREVLNLPKNTYSDELLLEELRKSHFDYNLAADKLFENRK